MTDFRALCTELVDELSVWTGYGDPEADFDGVHALITRARTALAEDPVGPTDEELWAVGDEDFLANYYPTDAIKFARAVLAKWGCPTAQPVALSERLPGDALSWWYEPDEDDDEGYGGKWTLLRIRGATYTYTHWLPANALPTPEAP